MPMDYAVVAVVALCVAALTLFSGFGLGTILMPVMAIFFPLPVAVAATAIVHLANNLFKVFLVGRKADTGVVLRFGLPAALGALGGALLLLSMSDLQPLLTYTMADNEFAVSPVKVVIALLIVLFALFDLVPGLSDLAFDKKYLPLGGALSGFFGGLSGHQGALRSAFLVKTGLPKEVFVGTNTLTAVVVDVTRLLVYGVSAYALHWEAVSVGSRGLGLVLVATLAAFVGSFFGAKLVKKVTMKTIQQVVGTMLIIIAVLLGSGII